jgi:hypothetical protein
MSSFREMLDEQRWDDHRYYHHNRINQSLHLFSSLCFIAVYFLLATKHFVAAAILGWPVSMIARQIGHFFFEPKSFDEINQATHEYKESVKVGYNLNRKVWLLSIFFMLPFVLHFAPGFFGLFTPHSNFSEYLDHLSRILVALAVGAVLFRGVSLFFLQDVKTGVVWMTKIVTDPFHDIKLYWRAPLQALRGEMMAPASQYQRHA